MTQHQKENLLPYSGIQKRDLLYAFSQVINSQIMHSAREFLLDEITRGGQSEKDTARSN